MAGIQVHTESPINPNASKSQEATAEPTQTSNVPVSVPATTTASTINSAPSAQPGAPAVPAPSTAAQVYTPPSPTRTTALPASVDPPPPQPGQVPQPTRYSTIPAPPQTSAPAEVSRVPPPPPPAPAPIQTWPATAYAQPPAGVTSTNTQDLSHPPGYVQDHHASFDDRYVEPENETFSSGPGKGAGILDGNLLARNTDAEPSPIWDTAVSWAKEAGRKLSVVEGEVWKKLNGDK